MKITLIQVGKTVNSYLIEGVNEYQNRLKHYCNFELITILPPKSLLSGGQSGNIKKTEATLILSKINSGDFVVLLDEHGNEFNSMGFADFINNHQIKSTKNLVFIIGGAFGFAEDLYQRCNFKIALSQLTFSHQMVRLFFTEQLYRAFTIIKGESYHHV